MTKERQEMLIAEIHVLLNNAVKDGLTKAQWNAILLACEHVV